MTSKINVFLIVLCLTINQAGTSLSQTPAPLTETAFLLPLADNTTATAMILPLGSGQAYLIYTTTTGKMVLYVISPKLSPEPIPPIPPTPQPDPPKPIPPAPTPTKLIIGVVEDPRSTTFEEKSVLVDSEWRNLAITKHSFIGLIPKDIIEKETGKPPAKLKPFLDAASSKQLPCLIIFDSKMSLLYSTTIPKSASEMTDLIRKYGG